MEMLVVLFVVLSLTTSAAQEDEELAVLKPTDPHILEGRTLILNCTLTGYKGNWNSSFLCIFSKDINYSKPFIVSLDEKTAQFKLENVKINHTGLFVCRLRDIYLGKLAKQYVKVIREPKIPELTNCTLRKLEIFECFWLPSATDQRNYTNCEIPVHMLDVYTQRDHVSRIDCSEKAISNCSFSLMEDNGGDILSRLNEEICVRVVVKSNCSKEVYSDIKCFNITSEIYPETPEFEKEVLELPDDRCLMKWRQPFYERYKNVHLTFYITLIPSYDKTRPIYYEVNGLSLLFESCHPNTNYLACISSMSVVGGYYSEIDCFSFDTNSTVPCQAVQLSPHTVFLDPQSHKILIYWQPLAEKDYCGPGFHYVLLSSEIGTGNGLVVDQDGRSWLPQKNISASHSFLQFQVCDSCFDCNFTIAARNTKGYQRGRFLPIQWVDRKNLTISMVTIDNLIVEVSDSNAILSWKTREEKTAMPSGDISVVVYICRNLVYNICRSDLKWEVAGSNTGHYNLSLDSPDREDMNYGVALFAAGVAREIFWSRRVYGLYGAIPSPTRMTARKSEDEANGVVVYWSFSQDDCTHCPYVSNFVVFSCCSSDAKSCDGNVSEFIVPNTLRIFTIHNLDLWTPHLVWMTSQSRMSKGLFTERILIESSVIGTKYIVLFSLLFMTISALVIFCIVRFYKECIKCKNKIVEINVPSGGFGDPRGSAAYHRDGYTSIGRMPNDPGGNNETIECESEYPIINQHNSAPAERDETEPMDHKMMGALLRSPPPDLEYVDRLGSSEQSPQFPCSYDMNDYTVVRTNDVPPFDYVALQDLLPPQGATPSSSSSEDVCW